jgi:hypothetical protein
MITDFVVSSFLAAFAALFGLIPAVGSAPSHGAFDGVAQQVVAFNDIFPLVTLLEVLGIILALEVAIYLWDLILFVYHQFWGSD